MKWSLITTATLFLAVISNTVFANLTQQDEAVSFEKTPEKVVALNWTQAEILLSLGIEPAGVTSIKGYKQWQSNNPPMPDGVAELGQRTEPGLEAIAAIKPDLILGYQWRHNRIYNELNSIAPTVLYRQYPSTEDDRSYFARMQGIYTSVAGIFGKQQQAREKLNDLHEQLRLSREQIKKTGLSGQKVVVGKFVGMGLGLRVYGPLSMAGALVNELGLENGWTATLPGRDFTHVDLLKLSDIGQASLIIIGDTPEEAGSMLASPVWQSLPAVQENRIYYIPSLWSFGGPDSALRLTKALTEQLVSEG
ncbi:iron-siderophore ABC transporter substrate-binding protein [Endozoicomonas sp. OPT23]|uniref:ABC transporter substrate-binding protein n=1 Tax=Endozoicomonas sp. OPT23 TaxID=2072845 RepID=UPI00129C0224